MTWRLLPGLRLVRRDARHLQIGVDPPLAAVLPDEPAVRGLLRELAAGAPLAVLEPAATRALEVLVDTGLVVSAEAESVRRAARARFVVHLDAPDDVLPDAARAVREAGLGLTDTGTASVALVWSTGETDRDRLDEWMRSGTPHLVVAEVPGAPVVGPYVVPGATACVRCIDAEAGERDPRRSIVVSQAVVEPPLRAHAADPTLRRLAVAWAVRDLVVAADGGRPATWSAVVRLGTALPEPQPHLRHPHCGCCWDLRLAPTG